jgi:hypothetical protein
MSDPHRYGPTTISGGALAIGFFFVVAWLGLSLWLSELIGWPRNYGFECRGRSCLIQEFWHSPSLLGHGLAELALFVTIWSLPVFFVTAIMWPKIRGWRRANLSDSKE